MRLDTIWAIQINEAHVNRGEASKTLSVPPVGLNMNLTERRPRGQCALHCCDSWGDDQPVHPKK